MARTAVTPAQLVKDTVVAPTSTTINTTLVTNGVTIAAARFGRLVIRVANSDTNPHNLLVRAAPDVPGNSGAWMAGQGDLTVAVAASSTVELTGVDSARFSQPDGSLLVDFSSGFTGAIETLLRP